MRRWISDWLDDAMMPLLKAMAPGYHRRMEPYRPARTLSPGALTDLARTLPPVAPHLVDEGRWRGFVSQGFAFPSPFPGGPPHNQTARGRLLYAGSQAPWVVVVPGYATGATPPFEYGPFQLRHGRGLLQQGVNVALIDLPYHLSRKAPGRTSGEGFFSPDLQASQEAALQGALDVIALTRWLDSHFRQPVGLWGTSLGGCIGGLAASQVEALAGVALMEPLDNPGDTIADLPGTREIREVLERHGVEPSRLHELFAGVAPSSYRPAVAPDRILFVTADWDRVVNAEFQEAFWKRWGCPPRIRRPAGHIMLFADRDLTQQVISTLVGWLRQDPD